MFTTTRRAFIHSAIGAVGGLPNRVRGEQRVGVNEPIPRRSLALAVRQKCAMEQSRRAVPRHTTNGDEQFLASRGGNFTKGLPHAQSGEVDRRAYDNLLDALRTGDARKFEKLARGSGMRMVSPQAAFSLHLEGGDAETFALSQPLGVTTAPAAAEAVELYWQALARDVPFADYATSPIIQAAATEIDGLSATTVPRLGGRVTSATVFRGDNAGSVTGPFLSQFLWKPIPMGSTLQEQKYRTPAPGNDFVTAYPEWLQIQTGVPPWREYRWLEEPRHILTGRDLAEYIHYDFLYQAFLNAALIVMQSGPGSIYNTNYYFSSTNPYKQSKTVAAFVTLGFAQVVDWLARVTTAALKAAWYQKWVVHRYLRPEEFGGLVHRTKTGMANYALHADIMDSRAVAETHKRFGSYLLPQAYPEGCPLHPAYPSGHATVAGACATILKAMFDENLAVPGCVVPDAGGDQLVPYAGPVLTVRGELEKLAFNVSIGRNFGGIHWRSDAVGGVTLGEEVAITILQDLVNTLAEDFPGFRFTRFNGQPVSIAKMS